MPTEDLDVLLDDLVASLGDTPQEDRLTLIDMTSKDVAVVLAINQAIEAAAEYKINLPKALVDRVNQLSLQTQRQSLKTEC